MVAVDDRLAPEELDPLTAVADVVQLVGVGLPGSECVIQWLHHPCSSDWILRIDSDEVPCTALIGALPDLIARTDAVQYVLPRRW